MPDESSIETRSDERLLRDFCITLDTIARHEGKLGLETFVEDVQRIHAELVRRGLNWRSQLQALAESSGRDMARILEECVGIPPTRD